MKKTLLSLMFIVTALPFLFAGHHFESDMAKKYPQLDLTDIFVFKSATPGKTVFIMSFNPQSKKDSISNYSNQGIYRFCIGEDKNFTKGFSPTFTFKGQNIQFYIADQAEPTISSKGTFIGEGAINKELQFANGIKIWTGTVLDLFQGNAGGINPFKEQASKGIYDLSQFDVGEAGNIFATLPSTVIVMEIPNSMLSKNIYYYATTALEVDPGHWHRVNRIAHVLFPHLYLLDQNVMSKYMESNHQVDEDVKSAIYTNILNYITIAKLQKDPEAYAKKLIERIYPDIITYEVGSDAEYTINKINGRPLQADAMDIALALLVGSDTPIDDKVAIILERYQDEFPYVVPIDEGYSKSSVQVIDTTDENSNKNWTYIFGLGLLIIIIGLFIVKKMKAQ